MSSYESLDNFYNRLNMMLIADFKKSLTWRCKTVCELFPLFLGQIVISVRYFCFHVPALSASFYM